MNTYTNPVLSRLSQKLMAYAMSSWCRESLAQSERELSLMQPKTELERIDRNFWLTQIRNELERRQPNQWQ